jgi:hypothetical protein
VGFVHGGLTGAGRWDWNKALAGGLSGAMIGAGVGLMFTGGGGFVPSVLSGALLNGGINGFSTFQNGYTVDWGQWAGATATGAVVGAITGAVGWGMGRMTTFIGQGLGVSGWSLLPRVGTRLALGFVDGAVTDAVSQGLNIATGQQPNGFSVTQMLAAGGMGAVLGLFKNTCFTRGTEVMVPLWEREIHGETPPEVGWTIGWKAIELIEENEWVLAKDENNPNGPLMPKRVEEKFRRWGHTSRLRVWGREIGTTKEHPFFVVNNGKWTAAAALELGHHFLSHDGQQPAFEGLEESGEFEELFNLRVQDYHTYFIGGEDWTFSIWAHNALCATLREFSRAYRRTFGIRSAADGVLLFRAYQIGTRMRNIPVLGRFPAFRIAGRARGFRALNMRDPPWSLRRNDAYIQGLIDRRRTILLATNPNDPASWIRTTRRGTTAPSVYRRELDQLERAGYRFEERGGQWWAIPP